MGYGTLLVNPLFGSSVFICSKPLQFLACAAIVRRFAIPRAEIFVVTGTMADADGWLSFARASSYSKLFSRIHRSSSHHEAVKSLRLMDYEALFVEDDRVSHYHLVAPAKHLILALFEEGYGTYRGDYRAKLSGLRRVRWQLSSLITGCGLQFGDGRLTDHVIVQYPDVYARLNPRNARKVLQATKIRDEIAELSDDWAALLSALAVPNPSSTDDVGLVLGTWGGAPQVVLTTALEKHDVVYYKPHPHDGIVPQIAGVEVIAASWVPAEVYIEYLASRCDALTVYHYSSTVALNCLGLSANVKFVDLLDDPRVVEVRTAIRDAQPGGRYG